MGIFHNIVVFHLARERGGGDFLSTSVLNKLTVADNIGLNQMPHSHIITALCTNGWNDILYLNHFSFNTLTHLCTNDFNFHAYCRIGKSEFAKINAFYFGPKTAKF